MSKKEAGNQGFCLIIRFPIDQRWSNINSAASTWDSLQTKASRLHFGSLYSLRNLGGRGQCPALSHGLWCGLGLTAKPTKAITKYFLIFLKSVNFERTFCYPWILPRQTKQFNHSIVFGRIVGLKKPLQLCLTFSCTKTGGFLYSWHPRKDTIFVASRKILWRL